jgi:hypothetical protein
MAHTAFGSIPLAELMAESAVQGRFGEIHLKLYCNEIKLVP